MTSDDDADVVVDDLEKAAFIARESPTSSPTTSRRAEKMRAGCVGGLVVLAILAFASTFATFAAPRVGGGRLVESEAHQQREIMELRTQVEELTRRVDGGGGANASRATRVEEAQARESTDDDDAVVVFPPSPSPPPPFAIVTWAHPPPPPNDAGTGAVVATNAAATPPTLCSELLRVASNHSAAVRLLSLAQQPSAAALGDAPSPALTRACGGGGGAGGAKKPVVDVFVFGGGEIDTLEIRLHELHDVVDAFVAVRSNVTHKGEPSFDAINRAMKSPRFARYADKVEVVTVNENVARADATGVNFAHENYKTEWVTTEMKTRYANAPDTIILFGHVDEIPNRDDVWRLANCDDAATAPPSNFAIWFPFGNIEYAFRSDFPARGMTWTLGDPGAYLASDVQGLPRGSLPRVAGGGFHASSYCFPPAVILKEATATEYTGYEKYVGDLRVAMATAADARAGGLGDARGACAAAMQSIRSECLKPRLPERMRKVNELINSDGGLKETFKLPALLSGPDAFKRFPGWDPSGVAVDERAVDVPAGWDVVQRR